MEEQALEIVKKLAQKGYKAYYAGGYVRDKILGHPSDDIDIATDATPEVIQKLFSKTIPKGAAFGVISVMLKGHEFEVATFRKESKYSDGRHPDHVEFTDDRGDAERRDFTINGMFYDPLKQKIIDYVEGQTDLKKKIIRTIGEPTHRFDEDKLRLLRAVRFASRLGFEIEANTAKALQKMAREIHQVSAERIREEILKILTSGQAKIGFLLMDQLGLLKEVLPEVFQMKGVEQPPEFHPEGDVFVHTMMMLEMLKKEATPDFAFAVLLHDVGKPPTFVVKERIRFDGHVDVGAKMAKEICGRLKFSNKSTEHIAELIRQHLIFKDVKKMRESTLKRFLRQDGFQDHLELHRIDCLSSHGILENYEFCKEKLHEFSQEKIKPKLLLNGHDLLKMGLKSGPLFRKLLTLVEDAQLEGKLKTKKEALKLVKDFLKEDKQDKESQ